MANKSNILDFSSLVKELKQCAEELEKLNWIDKPINGEFQYFNFDTEEEYQEAFYDRGTFFVDSDDLSCTGVTFCLNERGEIWFDGAVLGDDDPYEFDDHVHYFSFFNNKLSTAVDLLELIKRKIESLKKGERNDDPFENKPGVFTDLKSCKPGDIIFYYANHYSDYTKSLFVIPEQWKDEASFNTDKLIVSEEPFGWDEDSSDIYKNELFEVEVGMHFRFATGEEKAFFNSLD